MCEEGNWEPFQIVEKERGEPAHRCYQRCTSDECTDIRVRLFDENTIEIEGYDDMFYGNSDIEEIE